jgi:hypothetical protein
MFNSKNIKKGHYYEVVFHQDTPRESIYLCIGLGPSEVTSFFRNGKEHEISGLVTGADSVVEIPKYHALNINQPKTNESALHLMEEV